MIELRANGLQIDLSNFIPLVSAGQPIERTLSYNIGVRPIDQYLGQNCFGNLDLRSQISSTVFALWKTYHVGNNLRGVKVCLDTVTLLTNLGKTFEFVIVQSSISIPPSSVEFDIYDQRGMMVPSQTGLVLLGDLIYQLVCVRHKRTGLPVHSSIVFKITASLL